MAAAHKLPNNVCFVAPFVALVVCSLGTSCGAVEIWPQVWVSDWCELAGIREVRVFLSRFVVFFRDTKDLILRFVVFFRVLGHSLPRKAWLPGRKPAE